GHLYVIGGVVSSGATLSNVQHAPLAANGTIGTWTATTPLATSVLTPGCIARDGFIYVFGGNHHDSITPADVDQADVQVAPVVPDGALGPWKTTTIMPVSGRSASAVVEANGR